jgi:hypothetical protein
MPEERAAKGFHAPKIKHLLKSPLQTGTTHFFTLPRNIRAEHPHRSNPAHAVIAVSGWAYIPPESMIFSTCCSFGANFYNPVAHATQDGMPLAHNACKAWATSGRIDAEKRHTG